MGDSELVIKQINVVYMTRDPRLGFYRGTIVEILNTFLETKLVVIPRKHNMQAHSLVMFASTCKFPFQPQPSVHYTLTLTTIDAYTIYHTLIYKTYENN